MFVRVIQAALNYLGILNFKYDKKTRKFKNHNLGSCVSVLIFTLLHVNVYFNFVVFFREIFEIKAYLIFLLSAADLLCWETFLFFLFFERKFRFKKYQNLMNLLLKTDRRLKLTNNKKLMQKCTQLMTFFSIFLILYCPIRHFSFPYLSFPSALRDFLYAFAFINPWLLVGITEICFFYKVTLNHILLRERLTKVPLHDFFEDYYANIELMQHLQKVFAPPKVIHLTFILVLYVMNCFYHYFEQMYEQSITYTMYFWNFEICFGLSTLFVWSSLNEQVSIVLAIIEL